MQNFPHRYQVRAAGNVEGSISVTSPRLPELVTAAPAEFGGPGDRWSPETLLMAAVADCFILTFRAVARLSKVEWTHLSCEAEGVLDKVEGVTRFTDILLRVELEVPDGVDQARAQRALEKAERGCLISNSLVANKRLETVISKR